MNVYYTLYSLGNTTGRNATIVVFSSYLLTCLKNNILLNASPTKPIKNSQIVCVQLFFFKNNSGHFGSVNVPWKSMVGVDAFPTGKGHFFSQVTYPESSIKSVAYRRHWKLSWSPPPTKIPWVHQPVSLPVTKSKNPWKKQAIFKDMCHPQIIQIPLIFKGRRVDSLLVSGSCNKNWDLFPKSIPFRWFNLICCHKANLQTWKKS